MNSPAKDIATLLEGVSSLGLTQATNLFYARMPETKDATNPIVTVVGAAGSSPMLQYVQSRSKYYYSAVTVYVRHDSYDAGYSMAFDIMDYLHGLGGVSVGTVIYLLIKATQDPQLLKYDENDRPVFIVNFEIQRRES